MPSIKASLAEFVGTFALMFVGGGAMIVTGGESLLAIASGGFSFSSLRSARRSRFLAAFSDF